MDQFQIYENLTNLYSDDEEARFNALLSKKDWILDRYYLPFEFVSNNGDGNYSDLECLLRQALPFKTRANPRLADTKELKRIARFNEKYRYVKVHDTLPTRPNPNVFYVEVNFKKLEKDDYRTLVSNFYYCLSHKYTNRSDFKETDIRSILLPAMHGGETESVIILEKDKLENGCFKIDGMTKIYVYDDWTEKEEELINKIIKFTNLKGVIVHV